MKLPILTYHNILPYSKIEKIQSDFDRIYYLDELIFARQMSFIRSNGFTTLNFDHILMYLNDINFKPEKAIMVTFDDGMENNYSVAFPIIKKNKISATFFISTKHIGQKGYLNWDQIRIMTREGMSFQSHSHSHQRLSDLDFAQIKEELSHSKNIIESNLQKEVFALSLPFGKQHTDVKEIAQSLGYRFICTSQWDVNKINEESFFLKRVPIRNGDSIIEFKSFIELDNKKKFVYKILKSPIKIAKKIIGINNYNKLWCYFWG